MSTTAIDSLTVQAPDGSHFESEEVKTAAGSQSLGEVPLLVWDTLEGVIAHYGEEGVLNALDGTSLRVSYQGIARRMAIAKKTPDEIAKALVDFRPGRRTVGASTPATRVAKAAKNAVEKGANADQVSRLLELAAEGKIDLSQFIAE